MYDVPMVPIGKKPATCPSDKAPASEARYVNRQFNIASKSAFKFARRPSPPSEPHRPTDRFPAPSDASARPSDARRLTHRWGAAAAGAVGADSRDRGRGGEWGRKEGGGGRGEDAETRAEKCRKNPTDIEEREVARVVRFCSKVLPSMVALAFRRLQPCVGRPSGRRGDGRRVAASGGGWKSCGSSGGEGRPAGLRPRFCGKETPTEPICLYCTEACPGGRAGTDARGGFVSQAIKVQLCLDRHFASKRDTGGPPRSQTHEKGEQSDVECFLRAITCSGLLSTWG